MDERRRRGFDPHAALRPCHAGLRRAGGQLPGATCR